MTFPAHPEQRGRDSAGACRRAPRTARILDALGLALTGLFVLALVSFCAALWLDAMRTAWLFLGAMLTSAATLVAAGYVEGRLEPMSGGHGQRGDNG